MAPWILLVFAIIAGGLAWLVRRAYPQPLPGIPYKEASVHRLLGDLPDILAYRRECKETSETIFRICGQIGSPIAQLFFKPFSRPYIVLTDPREVEDVLVRRNREFDRATPTARIFEITMPECTLAQQTTPKLRAQKRLWSDVMGTGFLRRVVGPRLCDAAVELVEFWRLRAAAATMTGGEGEGEGEEPFFVYGDFECAAIDAIWAAVIGTRLGLVGEKIRSIQPSHGRGSSRSRDVSGEDTKDTLSTGHIIREGIEAINNVVDKVVKSPVPAFTRWWLKKSPALVLQKMAMEKEIRKVVIASCERFNKAVEAGQGEDEALDTCAMDLVLRREILTAKKKGLPMPSPADDRSFQDELQLLLQAAGDSTSHTLSWFVKYMSTYQQVQAIFREELRRAFPGPDLPTAAQLVEADVPYLDAVVEETLRFSVTAGVIPREAMVDTQLLGYHIPKGTFVFLSTQVLAEPLPLREERRSESSRAALEKRGYHGLYGEEARNLDMFEPARWIVRDEKGKETFDPNSLPALWFGGGYRGCFGRKLAMLELRIMAAMLVLSFEFLPLPEPLNSMTGEQDGIFRRPEMSYARIRAL